MSAGQAPPERTSLGNEAVMKLADLVDAPMLTSMLEDFYALTSIPMALIDLDGAVVVGTGWQRACTDFHRVNAETCAHCVASDTLLTEGITPGEARLYKCENGMWDAATPILIGDKLVGNLFTGQFFFGDEVVDLDFFRAQARRYGFDEAAYLEAIASVPRLSQEAVDIGLQFLTKLSTMISQLSYSNAACAHMGDELGAALAGQTARAESLTAEWDVLYAVMENTDTALAYLDRDFAFVAVNSSYALSSGHSREELIGKNHFDLFPDEENEAIFRSARETGERVEYRAKPFEFHDQPWRGVTYWDWSLTPVRGRDGQLKGLALSLQDVSRSVRQQFFSSASNRVDDIIHAQLDFAEILSCAVPELARAVGCEVVAIALRRSDGRWHIDEAEGLPALAIGSSFDGADFPEAAQAAASGRPVVAVDPVSLSPAVAELRLQSVLVVPLSISAAQEGIVLYAHSSGPGAFDEYAIDFAGKTAGSLSLALNNARLFHEAEHSARLSETLATINEMLLSTLTLEDVVARLVGDVSVVAGADMSLVIEVRDDEYAVTHVRGVDERWQGVHRGATFFPAFAIAATTREPLLIDDTWADPRTNKEFVVPADLRAFQLLPLVIQGVTTHVLALAYHEPQAFEEVDKASAKRMAAAMSVALNSARLYENEHRIADRLQEALLALPAKVSGIDLAHAYRAASEDARVGGDFFDAFEIGEHHLGITIGDVAGKGLDAAVLTSLAKNTVRAHASEPGKNPMRVLALANDVIFKATTSESFVTLLLAVLDCRDGRLVYASAGHPSALLIDADGCVRELPSTGPLLGALPHSAYGEREERLGSGGLLFLYTDGLTEARRDGAFYGDERLVDLLAELAPGDAEAVVEGVVEDVLEFSGGRLVDDLAIMAVKRPPTT